MPAVDPHVGDAALVARMAGGERDALALLYGRHAGALLALARRIVGERREAEDLVHDVFLEAWRQASAYDPARGSARCWLVTRMRSRALDRWRALGAARHAAEEGGDPGDVARPEDEVASAPDRAALRRAIVALPAEQRRVLELGYFEGLSSSEIAERISVPLGTVKSRAAAALARLRSLFSRREEDRAPGGGP